MPKDNTFSSDDREVMEKMFGAYTDEEMTAILWRASHSETFGADLRSCIEAVWKPEVVKNWKS